MAWRLIITPPSDGPSHMALDEALLTSFIERSDAPPVLRLYTWSGSCQTIGYFQKYADADSDKGPITRRLTGGLTVAHGGDLSYAMIAGKKSWPWLYDQMETYRRLHGVIQSALAGMGFSVGTAESSEPLAGGLRCIETVYPYDVLYQGKKAVGSCQRRRGESILVQGSIHIPSLTERVEECASGIGPFLSRLVGDELIRSFPEVNEIIAQRGLMSSRYAADQWNRKY